MPSYSHRSTPLGVKIIAAVGLLGCLLDLLSGLGLVGSGLFSLGTGLFGFVPGFSNVVGGALTIVIALVKALVLLGLLALLPWAWSAALVVYGLDFVVNLLSGDVFGAVLALVIAGYLYSQKRAFEGRGY